MRKNGLPGRSLKRPRRRSKKQTGVYDRHGARVQNQEQGSGHQQNLRECKNPPAVIAVGNMARMERKKKKRSHLNKANIAENDRRARVEVKIPTGCYKQHLQAEGCEEASRE